MMKEHEFLDTLRKFDEFGFFLEALARRHLNDGGSGSAGVVLTLAFEVKSYVREWASTTPHDSGPTGGDACDVDGCTAPVTGPGLPYCERHRAEKTKVAQHRHDYEPSITRGDKPPVCACGKFKNPNGRPRKQQLIAPPAGGSS